MACSYRSCGVLGTTNANGDPTVLRSDLDSTYYVYHRQSNTNIEDNILKIDGEIALFKDAFWVMRMKGICGVWILKSR